MVSSDVVIGASFLIMFTAVGHNWLRFRLWNSTSHIAFLIVMK